MLGKKIALGFGIAIIFPLMVHYGFATFSTPPKMENVKWISYPNDDNRSKASKEYTRNYSEQVKKYQTEMNQYSEKKFYVIVPIGVLAILVGVFIPLQAIGTGLIFGGIFTLIEGYLGYWQHLSNELKFISLLIAFVLLITTGYKKIR